MYALSPSRRWRAPPRKSISRRGVLGVGRPAAAAAESGLRRAVVVAFIEYSSFPPAGAPGRDRVDGRGERC